MGMAVTLGRPPADLPFLQVDWFISGSSLILAMMKVRIHVGDAVVPRCWSMDEGAGWLPEGAVECLLWLQVPVSGAVHIYTRTQML